MPVGISTLFQVVSWIVGGQIIDISARALFLLILMLPQNNYLAYQKLPQQSGQYTFDLKVNVDFDRR